MIAVEKPWDELDRYLIITSDAHGGAASADYKPYLEARWHDEFDAWLAGVVMPWVDVTDTSNWDSDARIALMDADGVSAEIIFPNTLPPFFDILAHLSGVPRDRATVRSQVGRPPGAQPLAGRLLRLGPRPVGGASCRSCPTTSTLPWPRSDGRPTAGSWRV